VKLEAKHIVKKYRSRTVVNDVSFEVNQGEIVGLLGPNGAGKTTSFYTVVGLIRPYSGEVLLDGRSIQKDAYVQTGTARNRLFGAGGFGLSQAQC
jgi:lipopolysaccharide export system ATP-binding protein